jgi:4-amino-4-deoxy-L-arabinose transferase-like glycosyltransferase
MHPRRTIALAAALLLLQYGLAANSLVRENPTIDEVVHLPAGITYWQRGTFKVYHHNPPLVKMVAALPVLFSNPNTTAIYGSSDWRSEYPAPASVAFRFMEHNAGRFLAFCTQARLLMPLFALLGGWVVFVWSRRLYGDLGGLLSLVLWTFCPNVLAHGRLITSDMGATALGAAATYVFWRYLHAPTWRWTAWAGIALGIGQLTKFSLLLLYVIWPVIWLIFEVARWDGACWTSRVGRAALQGLLIVGISILVIDLGYGFEDVGIPLGKFDFASRTLTVEGKTPRAFKTGNDLLDESWKRRVNRFRGSWMGAIPAPLPKHFLLGFDEQKIEADGVPQQWLTPDYPDPTAVTGYPVYLDGVHRRHGWRDYYFRCLVYKTPEGTWVLALASFVVLIASRRAKAAWPDELVLIVMPASVFLAMSFLTDINLGLRYILPMFPYVFISIGKTARWAEGLAGRARWAAWGAITAAALATVAASLSIHPSYLAYFNVISGGPDRAPARLIDSNLDWGQDLVGLREWVRAHPSKQPIGLAYFGQISPSIFEAQNDGFAWFVPPARPNTIKARYGSPHQTLPTRVEPGVYAISATYVYGLPYRVDDPTPGAWRGAWNSLGQSWSYFQLLKPFHRIGHSILLYDVTPEQAERLNRVIDPG